MYRAICSCVLVTLLALREMLRSCVYLIGIWLLLLTQAMAQAPLNLVIFDYAPYNYEEGGDAEGFATDIVRETFRRMEIPVSITAVPWARGILKMKKGTVDGIFTIYRKAEREKFADFSEEVLVVELVSLFVLADSPITFDGDLVTLLKQYQFGTVRGYSYGKAFDEARKLEGIKKPTETATSEQNVLKLLKKRYSIMVNDKYVALDILRRLNKTERVKELIPSVQEVPAYLAFSKASKYPNLREIRTNFDAALRQMKVDGTYDQIIDSFFKRK